MKVTINVTRALQADVPPARSRSLLDDVEATLRRFPGLRSLERLAPDVYLWTMKPIGSRLAQIEHEVVYAARYRLDRRRQRLLWEPVAGHGNAALSGHLGLESAGEGTRFEVAVTGELRDVPVPLLYRPLAPAFVQAQFVGRLDRFLEKLRAAVA